MRKTIAVIATLAGFVAASHAHADASLAESSSALRQASHLLVAMEGDAHRVAGLLRTARASHAVGPAKCVDGYLSQIDASVRHGRDDVAEIRAAIVTNDQPAAIRAMGWLEARREAARTASFAADSCLTPAAAQERDHTVVHVVTPVLPSDRAVFSR